MDIDVSLSELIEQRKKQEKQHNGGFQKKVFKNGHNKQNGNGRIVKRGGGNRQNPIIQYVPVPVPVPTAPAMSNRVWNNGYARSPIKTVQHVRQNQIASSRRPRVDNVKVHISNLGRHVTKENLEDVFQKFNFTRISVHHDEDGRPLGSADIFFETTHDAHQFRQELSGATLDGRPMTVSVVTPHNSQHAHHHQARPRIQPQFQQQPRGNYQQRQRVQPQVIQVPIQLVPTVQQRPFYNNQRGGRGFRGGQQSRGGRLRAGGGKFPAQSKKTMEQLDQELDAYMAAGSDDQ